MILFFHMMRDVTSVILLIAFLSSLTKNPWSHPNQEQVPKSHLIRAKVPAISTLDD